MKRKFLLFVAAVVLSIGAIAQNKSINKRVDGPAFENLNVSGPVSVELIESENPSVETVGTHYFVNSVNISWWKKTLYISFPDAVSPENNVVKIYVKNLKHIIAEEGARIVTPQPLKSENLQVTVRDKSQAKVMNYGKIRVSSPADVRVSQYAYKAY